MPGLQISCTIPMCLAMRRSHQEDLGCFLTLFEVHIGHAHWTSFNFKAPNAVVNVRLYSLVLVSMLNCFCKPTLGSQVSASQLMRSTRERKTWCHFGPYPHPIKFDFTRIYMETVVYIHLANSWDHDVVCPSLVFPHQKTGFWFWSKVPILHLTWSPNFDKSCLESSRTALKKSHPESEQNQPIVVQLSCTRQS